MVRIMLILGKIVVRMVVDDGQVSTVYVLSTCGTHGTITIKRSCEENQRTLYRGSIDDCWNAWYTMKANLADEIIEYKEVR